MHSLIAIKVSWSLKAVVYDQTTPPPFLFPITAESTVLGPQSVNDVNLGSEESKSMRRILQSEPHNKIFRS